MKSIKEAFYHSFEQVGYDQEPEFTIHGIGYQGKWGKDTMAIFIKDLESVEDELKSSITQSINQNDDRIQSLEGKVDDLSEEITGFEQENETLECRVTELNEENERLMTETQELREEVESLRIANTAMAENVADTDSKITGLQVAISNLVNANEELEEKAVKLNEIIQQWEEQAQRE